MKRSAEVNLGNPAAVIDLMQGVNDPVLGEEVVLASAYYLTGNVERAKTTSRHISASDGNFRRHSEYLMLNTDDYDRYNQIVEELSELIDLFKIESLHRHPLWGVHTCAQGYAVIGAEDQALDLVERFVNLVCSDIYPLEFKGDEF